MSENRDNHGFSVLVAQEIGVNRAIMLQHFKHLQIAFLDKEKSAKDVWVKRSRRALSETYPYFTEKEIRGCLDRLERDEYIRAKVDNALNYDRTKSYQLDKKGWDLMGDPASDKRANRKEKASDKRANGFDERADDNITKGPMNIGSCNSVVTSFVEGERTPPTPNPSTSKEEKKEKGLVAPWQEEWLEAGNEWLEAQKTPSPKVAPKGFSPKIEDEVCSNCGGHGYDPHPEPIDGMTKICLICDGSGYFDVTAIASPTDLPGVTLVEAAPGFAEFEQDAGKENREVWAKIAPFPRVATTIEAEPPQPKKKPAPSAPAPHEENQEVFSYFDNAEKIGTAWRKWITEKWGQHKCKFKTVESEKIALRQLWQLSGGKADLADQIIDQSIANTWKGLFALKIQNNGTKPTIADRRRDATANMLRHVAEFGLG